MSVPPILQLCFYHCCYQSSLHDGSELWEELITQSNFSLKATGSPDAANPR